jgi:hypothetical protein
LVLALQAGQRRLLARLLAPNDAADFIQVSSPHERENLMNLMDETTRKCGRCLTIVPMLRAD